MENPNEPSSWATKDFTLPLLLSGVVSTVVCVVLCGALYLSRDYLGNDLAPKLGLVELTPTSTPVPACPGVPTGWEEAANHNFNNNKYFWPVGHNSDSYADTSLKIEDGLLRLNIKTHQGVYYPLIPSTNRAPKTFYATLRARKVSGSQDAEYGIIFRRVRQKFMYFAIQDSGRFNVYSTNSEGEWTPSLLDGYSENINVGESNNLVIFQQDNRYLFCINQYVVGEVDSADYPPGFFGVAVDLDNGNDEAVFEFDDLVIYSPPD
ncbi:MAG: hypothetical protein HZB50_02255 [Chloroflexi bacterium]|nr:hypothetical protein [Chloroflexota bacterium]